MKFENKKKLMKTIYLMIFVNNVKSSQMISIKAIPTDFLDSFTLIKAQLIYYGKS